MTYLSKKIKWKVTFSFWRTIINNHYYCWSSEWFSECFWSFYPNSECCGFESRHTGLRVSSELRCSKQRVKLGMWDKAWQPWRKQLMDFWLMRSSATGRLCFFYQPVKWLFNLVLRYLAYTVITPFGNTSVLPDIVRFMLVAVLKIKHLYLIEATSEHFVQQTVSHEK